MPHDVVGERLLCSVPSFKRHRSDVKMQNWPRIRETFIAEWRMGTNWIGPPPRRNPFVNELTPLCSCNVGGAAAAAEEATEFQSPFGSQPNVNHSSTAAAFFSRTQFGLICAGEKTGKGVTKLKSQLPPFFKEVHDTFSTCHHPI